MIWMIWTANHFHPFPVFFKQLWLISSQVYQHQWPRWRCRRCRRWCRDKITKWIKIDQVDHPKHKGNFGKEVPSPASVCDASRIARWDRGLKYGTPLNWDCNETMCDPARFQLLRLFTTINELGGLHLLWDIYSLTAFKRVASLCGVNFLDFAIGHTFQHFWIPQLWDSSSTTPSWDPMIIIQEIVRNWWKHVVK